MSASRPQSALSGQLVRVVRHAHQLELGLRLLAGQFARHLHGTLDRL
jgi:hypothetical protein